MSINPQLPSEGVIQSRFPWTVARCCLLMCALGATVIGIGVKYMSTQQDRYVVHEGMEQLGRPATEEEVRVVESALGVVLPDEYRRFLMDVNGIYCRYPGMEFRLHDRVGNHFPRRGLDSLYSIDPTVGAGNRLLHSQEAYGFNERVPDRLLAIGYCGSSDLICISLRGPDKGRVYYWDDPRPFDDELSESAKNTPTEQFLFIVGDDFRQFWNSLYAPPLDESGRVKVD